MSEKTIRTFVVLASLPFPCLPQVTINDVSRLNPVNVRQIISVSNVEQIKEAVKIATEQHLKLSIAGKLMEIDAELAQAYMQFVQPQTSERTKKIIELCKLGIINDECSNFDVAHILSTPQQLPLMPAW